MNGNTILQILRELVIRNNKDARKNWITEYLRNLGIQYEVQNFQSDGANIVINKSNKNKIIFSAHYDGNDPNDNLSSVAIILELIREHPSDKYLALLTDLEENQSKGMEAYIACNGTDLPLIVLELCGSGSVVHIGASSFIPKPPFETVNMDPTLLKNIEACVKELKYNYRIHLTPPGDHLHYAMAKGKAGLLSIINDIDFVVITKMAAQTPPWKLFDGIDRNNSVISRMPPFGNCELNDIRTDSLEMIYNIIVHYLNNKLR